MGAWEDRLESEMIVRWVLVLFAGSDESATERLFIADREDSRDVVLFNARGYKNAAYIITPGRVSLDVPSKSDNFPKLYV